MFVPVATLACLSFSIDGVCNNVAVDDSYDDDDDDDVDISTIVSSSVPPRCMNTNAREAQA